MNEIQDFKPISVLKQTLTCFDSDQLSEVIKGLDLELHQVGKGSLRSDLFHSVLGKGILDSARYSNSILSKGTLSKDYMTVGFIHDCDAEGVFNGHALRKHDILLGDEGGTLISCLSPNTHWSSFQFKRDDFLKTGFKLDTDNSKIYRCNKKRQKDLHLKLEHILKYLEKMPEADIPFNNGEMLYNYILSTYADALNQTQEITHLKQREEALLANKICRYLQENVSELTQMIHLTQLIGKSERTVERIFKKHFGIAPYAYLKLHRLHCIRRQLTNSHKINITHLAMENGFMQMGYFGSEYKKLFNEMPSETLKR